MELGDFERLVIGDTGMCVSVCRLCMKFVAAAPDPARLALAENLHRCCDALKKPPSRVSALHLERSRRGAIHVRKADSRN